MDPRIAKTRARLQEALFDLARERGIDDVTVTDIVQRAKVNRATFYLHYSDKETLLADALDGVAERAGASLNDIDIESDEPPAPLSEFLAHADVHAELYRRVFTEPGYSVALGRLQARIAEAIERHLDSAEKDTPPGVPIDFLIASVSGSMLGMIAAWLVQEPRATPTEAANWIWIIARPPRANGS